MSDPFSVAGSAVGVISLGISVCSGLTRFIGQIKNRRGELLVMEAWLDQLADFLGELQSIISTVNLSASASLHSSDTSITTLATAIEELRRKLIFHSKNQKSNSNLTDSLRKWRQNLTYPFKREDLLLLKDVVQDLQLNLVVALQALQLAQQQHNHISTSSRLANLSQLTVFNTQAVRNDVFNVRSTVATVHNALQPLYHDWPMIMAQLTTIANSVKHLETQLTDTAVDSYSPRKINQNIRRTQKLYQRITDAPLASSAIRSFTSPRCQCWSSQKSQSMVNRSQSRFGPISLVVVSFEQHSEECPFAFYSKARTSIALNLCFCSHLLRRKVDVAVQLLRQNGGFSITPTLRAVRIVPGDSPAFKLVWDFGWSPQDLYTSRALTQRLTELFETNQASPHDRLSSGYTLLHFLCRAFSYNWDLFGRTQHPSDRLYIFTDLVLFFLNVMGETRAELDDSGRSAFEMVSQEALFRVLSTKSISLKSGSFEAIEMYSTAIQNLHQLDLLGFTDIHPNFMTSILAKSAVQLKESIMCHADYLEKHGEMYANLVEATAVLGWQEGCNLLLNIKHCSRVWSGRNPLAYAVSGGDPGIVKLFLRQRRKTGNTSTLALLDLEKTIARGSKYSNLDLCVNQLVKQRQKIERLVKSHFPSHKCLPKDGRLLDAGVRGALASLQNKGVKINPYLHVFSPSIYHAATFDQETAETLYSVGFRDVQGSCFQNFPNFIPPLVWHSMRDTYLSRSPQLSFCQWLISKGANLNESFPNSNMTAWKIMVYQAGKEVVSSSMVNEVEIHAEKLDDFLLSLLAVDVKDTCSCACTPGGCSTISLFLKGGLSYADDFNFNPRPKRQIIFILISWIAPIIRAKRRLATFVFRALTFWQLQYNHACCDVESIIEHHQFRYQGDRCLGAVQQAYMSPHQHQNIDADEEYGDDLEDQHLISCIDDLIQTMEAEFEASDQDIVPFIMNFWSATMLETIQHLAATDNENYRIGREQLGVKIQPLDLSQTGLVGEVHLDDEIEAHVSVQIRLVRDVIPNIETLAERKWVMPSLDLGCVSSYEEILDGEMFPDDGLDPEERFEKMMEEARSSDGDSQDESSDDDSEDYFFVGTDSSPAQS